MATFNRKETMGDMHQHLLDTERNLRFIRSLLTIAEENPDLVDARVTLRAIREIVG